MNRRAVVAVVGLGTLACSGIVDDLVPPPDPLPYDPPPPLGREVPWDKTRAYTDTLNPILPGRGTAYRAGGRCFVHGEWDEPPTSWQPPKLEYVVCPPELRDSKWEACPGGSVRVTADGKDCLCTMDGNPPPPARAMVCPDVDG